MTLARAACGLFVLGLLLALADPRGAARMLAVAVWAHARLPR